MTDVIHLHKQFVCLRETANGTEHLTNTLLLAQSIAVVFASHHKLAPPYVAAALTVAVCICRFVTRILDELSRQTHKNLQTIIRRETDGFLCLPYVSPATSRKLQADDECDFGVRSTPSIVLVSASCHKPLMMLHQRIVEDTKRANGQMRFYQGFASVAEIVGLLLMACASAFTMLNEMALCALVCSTAGTACIGYACYLYHEGVECSHRHQKLSDYLIRYNQYTQEHWLGPTATPKTF